MSDDGWRMIFRRPVVRQAILVALVVGTVLNLINQGDLIASGDINWFKAVLTYLVPYCVASYGAYVGSRAAR